MDKMGQGAQKGSYGGIFSGQEMGSGRDMMHQDVMCRESGRRPQGQQALFGNRPTGYGEPESVYYCGQASGITGMPSICGYNSGYYDYTGNSRDGQDSCYGYRGFSRNADAGCNNYRDDNRSLGEGCYDDRDDNRGFGEGYNNHGDDNCGFGEGYYNHGDGNRGFGEGYYNHGDGNRGFGESYYNHGDGNRGFGEGYYNHGDGNRGFGEGYNNHGDGNRGFDEGYYNYGDNNRNFGERYYNYGDNGHNFSAGYYKHGSNSYNFGGGCYNGCKNRNYGECGYSDGVNCCRISQKSDRNGYQELSYAYKGQERRICQGYGQAQRDWRQPDRLLFLIVAVMGMGMLFFAFLATLFFLVCAVRQGFPAAGSRGEILAYEGAGAAASPLQDGIQEMEPDLAGQDMQPETGTEGEYYGEIRDAVRTDLPYSVEWENYEYEGNSDTVMILIDYPVIEGDVPNVDLLNDVIASEIDYFEEYYNEYSNYMLEDEVFAVYSEGFVTYMDEEVMSVVFAESIYTDYWVDSGLYCVNIDIENGVILDNGSILDVDDEFAIDFRTRSREQNGDISVLEYMTDQEVAYYLTDGSTGIIFYTPLGMEIGLNYGEDYVTVTYRDYREFLLRY